MRVLVTGEGGFTARHLAPLLADHGHEALPLAADVTRPRELAQRVAALAPEAVVHLAGLSFAPDGVDARVYAVNTVGAANLLEALANLPHPPRRVVLASSSHVYGAQAGRLAEDAPLSPATHYGASKLAMECLARPYRERLGVVIARPFNYTGAGQAARFLVPKLVAAFRARAPELRLGNRDIARDFSDVRHIVRAYLALLTADRVEDVYNLCSGRPLAIAALLAELEAQTGHRPAILTDPALMRPGETPVQYGDATRMQRLLEGVPIEWNTEQAAVSATGRHAGPPAPPLADTLRWMLAVECDGH